VYINVRTLPLVVPTVYEIDTPGCFYQARQNGFGNLITLSTPNERVLATVKRKFAILKTHYEFELQNGSKYQFESDGARKNAYACAIGADSYVWFLHKNLKYSLFQNGSQIAAMTREHWSAGTQVQCAVMMNDDANLAVVLCFALTACDMDRGESGSMTYDVGIIWGEDMPFDERWQPS
jgi:hypothetical protein